MLYHYSSHHLFELQKCLGTLYILDVVTKHKHTPTKTILRLFLNYKQFDSKIICLQLNYVHARGSMNCVRPYHPLFCIEFVWNWAMSFDISMQEDAFLLYISFKLNILPMASTSNYIFAISKLFIHTRDIQFYMLSWLAIKYFHEKHMVSTRRKIKGTEIKYAPFI